MDSRCALVSNNKHKSVFQFVCRSSGVISENRFSTGKIAYNPAMTRRRRGHATLARAILIGLPAIVLPDARAANPVVVQNQAGFEGLEEATVIYFPDTNTFQNDPTSFPNHVDKGGGWFRDTLRNYYTPQGWWDGDRDT